MKQELGRHKPSFATTKEMKWQIFNNEREVATLKKSYSTENADWDWYLDIDYAMPNEMIELLDYVKQIVELEIKSIFVF